MEEDQPGLVTGLESGPQAEDWQCSSLEVMDEDGAGGNAGRGSAESHFGLGTGHGEEKVLTF